MLDLHRPGQRRAGAVLIVTVVLASCVGSSNVTTASEAPSMAPQVNSAPIRATTPTPPLAADVEATQVVAAAPPWLEWDPLILPAELTRLPGVPCFSSASTAPWVKVFYLYQRGTPNRTTERTPTIREAVALADHIYARSAKVTGGVRHVRWKMTSGCKLVIVPVAMDLRLSLGGARDYLVAKGVLKSTEKGLAFREGSAQEAGSAQRISDNRPGSTNRNNRGGTLGWVYLDSQAGPWGDDVTFNGRMVIGLGQTTAHELAHTLGAVQRGAPHGTNGHCWDEDDVMCYQDAPDVKIRQICPATVPSLLDCRNDDYFHTNPKPGSYLATHWNIARSRFLATRSTSRWDELARASIFWRGVTEGSTLSVGTSVDVDVGAAPDGAVVAAVTLAVNDKIVDIDREAPFSVAFYPDGSVAAGMTVRLSAIAYDTNGRQALTPPMTVTVGEGGPGPRPVPTPPRAGFDVVSPQGGDVTGPFVVQVAVSDASISRVTISVNETIAGDATAPDWRVYVDPVGVGASPGDQLNIYATVTGADGTITQLGLSVVYLPS